MKKTLIALTLAALAAFAGQPLQKTDGTTIDKISAYYANKGEAKLEQIELVNDQLLSTLFDRAWEAYRAGDAEKMYDYATYTGVIQLKILDNIMQERECMVVQPGFIEGKNNTMYSLLKVIYLDKARPHSDDMRLVIVYNKLGDKWKIADMLYYNEALSFETQKIVGDFLQTKPTKQPVRPLF